MMLARERWTLTHSSGCAVALPLGLALVGLGLRLVLPGLGLRLALVLLGVGLAAM